MMEGPLSKWTNVMNGWQYRWFVLDEASGLLSYYTSKEKMMRGSRRGCVRLKGAVIGIDDEDESTFTITCDQKTFHFQARDLEEREKWIKALEETILRHTQSQSMLVTNGLPVPGSMEEFLAETLQGFASRSPFVPTIEDFDKRLAEADVYLQMLIDQTAALEDKIESCKSSGSLDAEDIAKYEGIKTTTDSMIESIKHTIVLLQIAKSYNVDTLYKGEETRSSIKISKSPASLPRASAPLAVGAGVDVETAEDALEDGATALTPSMASVDATTSGVSTYVIPGASLDIASPRIHASSRAKQIPPTSYSSSEDEEWEDAIEGEDEEARRGRGRDGEEEEAEDKRGKKDRKGSSQSQHSNLVNNSFSSLSETGTAVPSEPTENGFVVTPGSNGPSPFGGEGGGIAEWNDTMWDKLYGGEEDDDVGDMSQQSSMIGHLLSQLRIGMDLTKITLPTYILERRSLLEMYADFFAHTDLFVKIATCPTPQDRMVQCMRWYLSAFHAGRPSDVAKKPYNPIIGETFQCWMDPTSGDAYTPPDRDKTFAPDGSPCPWTKDTDVSFIAEQVSHHPPISGFYAECPAHKISANGYIWTKTKFLGLAICLENVGQGVVTLTDHEEDYVITFPKGYGRSILTVPWVELGGICEITCAKTGYSGKIDFYTKPFYGGDKHRIRAEVNSPHDKKPILVIEGQWNGIMTATDSKTKMTSEFVNTKTMPVIPKQVKDIAQQDEFESRRLWKEVTYCLKNRMMEKATGFKARLEQRQRDEAKERAEKGELWKTKKFHENGEHWVYDHPLIQRLN